MEGRSHKMKAESAYHEPMEEDRHFAAAAFPGAVCKAGKGRRMCL